MICGSAPIGTTSVLLAGTGRDAAHEQVPVYDAGPNWRHARFWAASWEAKAPLTVTALSGNGQRIRRISM
jgi:hypothetical protein